MPEQEQELELEREQELELEQEQEREQYLTYSRIVHYNFQGEFMQIEKLCEVLKVLNDMPNDREGTQGSAYVIHQNYLIRTVTHYYTGTLLRVFPHELVLRDAAWIADTGRLNVALTTGHLAEVEPIPGDVIIGRGAVVDAIQWTHPLPKEVK